MNIELKKIKIGETGRNGCKVTSADLYVDGVLTAHMLDEARGAMLRVRVIDESKYNAFVRGRDVDEWFAEELDNYEIKKTLKRKTKKAIVFVNDNLEIALRKFDVDIFQMMQYPKGRDLLMKHVQSMAQELDGQGFKLVNEELKEFIS